MDAASAAIAREKPVSIDGLLELAKPDMAKVDALIRDRMQSPAGAAAGLQHPRAVGGVAGGRQQGRIHAGAVSPYTLA